MRKRYTPLEEDFTLRSDGRYNFWQLMPFVEGYSATEHSPIWVLRGVFKRIPEWA